MILQFKIGSSVFSLGDDIFIFKENLHFVRGFYFEIKWVIL